VALGIIGHPELLFLDEPTTGFDPEARRQFWHLISGLAHSGTTILLTTHYLDEAEALANRVGVIAAGRIRAVDAPAELGGRATAKATVGWLAPDGRRSVQTDTPTRVVAELAGRFSGEVPELTVTPAVAGRHLPLDDRLCQDGAADGLPGRSPAMTGATQGLRAALLPDSLGAPLYVLVGRPAIAADRDTRGDSPARPVTGCVIIIPSRIGTLINSNWCCQ
jgi:hypothetical protein